MGPGHSDASAHETAATDAADTTDATEPDALPGDPWESDQSNADSAHGEDEEDEPWAEVTRDEPAVSLEDGAAEGADHALPADGSPAWSEGIEAAISRADAQFEAEAIPEEGSEVGPSDPVAPATTRTSRSARAYEDRHSSSSRLLVGIAAIVILVVAAALLYRFVLVPEVSDSPVVMADDSSATEGNGMPEAELDSSAVTTATPEEPTGSQGADAEDGPSANPSDPVRPTADPAATEALPTVTAGMGGYTLVVGSTLNAASAERVRGRFTDLGLPTGVLAVTADSTTRYRIAVGHFATAAGADSLRILKASELPEGTWVLSVR
ncbi:MAG: SPOR domain-containing protein [Bacteroidetes bacterium]|nr:SPOR domain-containing protein [Bacteroidota bacterium]